jgi:hypothetical protein
VKQSRIFSVAVASAAVVGSVVAVSGTANAAFDPTTADYVNSVDELSQETPGAPYPTTGWFLGAVAAPAGTVTFDGAGLNSAGGTVQVLNSSTASAADLTTLVSDADLFSTGDATFQVPLYLNSTGTDTDPTTLSPVAAGDAGFTATSTWVTSGALGTYAAGDTATLAEFQAEITAVDAAGDPATDATIRAYGFTTPSGSTSSVQGIAFGDESTYFVPAAEGTYQPTSLTLSELRSSGITVSALGYFPGETVEVYFEDVDAVQPVPTPVATLVADAQGAVTGQVVLSDAVVTEAGSYSFTLLGATSGVALTSVVEVTADGDVAAPAPTPVVPTAPVAPVAVPVSANASFTG